MRQVHCNDRVDRRGVDCVVLAYTNPLVAASIDDAVGKSPVAGPRGGGCQRLRLGGGVYLPIEPAIREIGEIENPLRHRPSTATIFVHACAHIVRRASDVGILSARDGPANDDRAALLLRSSFQPIDIPAVETHLG